MRVESFISYCDQSAIEPRLASARFVTRYEEDCLSSRIKRERHSPYATVCIKPELLHVRVLGPIQGIHARSLCPRSELLNHFRLREQLVLDRYRESIELVFKLVCELDDPRHIAIMSSIPYGSNAIYVIVQIRAMRDKWEQNQLVNPLSCSGRSKIQLTTLSSVYSLTGSHKYGTIQCRLNSGVCSFTSRLLQKRGFGDRPLAVALGSVCTR